MKVRREAIQPRDGLYPNLEELAWLSSLPEGASVSILERACKSPIWYIPSATVRERDVLRDPIDEANEKPRQNAVAHGEKP